MKRLATALAAVAALTFAGVVEASPSNCFGAPAGYVKRFDRRDGAVDGRVMYPEKRVFLEVQGWLTPYGGTPGHDSEHVHTGMCFPLGKTWRQRDDRRRLDVRYVFHNVVGYRVTHARGSFVSVGHSEGGIITTLRQAKRLTAAAAVSRDKTVTVFMRHAMKPMGTNGRKEFRAGIDLVRSSPEALVDRWFTSGNWWSTFNYPGLPEAAPIAFTSSIRSRNWFEIAGREDYNYGGYAGTWRASRMGRFRPDVWRVTLIASHGSEKESLHIDPNFHHHPHNPGLWSETFAFSDPRQVAIPLANAGIHGVHRLVYLAHQFSQRVKPVSTVVNVIPFRG